ncbi:MEDS domain-containing protein [Longispora fulva]|uniref:Anti-anti-sigma regulatory factor n=1 Tax=Longispora fulva TaxID=619741 RepID=A0A8J7GFM0_9ACTN|nr:MEDS domain-containing protein [Longispora fulva]MBG6135053.1 anti-anti-sigma regulatory factor [Longispora fulva]
MTDPTAVDQLRLSDHVCWTFDDDDRCAAAVARYVGAGTRDGHRVIYSAPEVPRADIAARLTAHGVHVAALVATGQLQIVTVPDTYLTGGEFRPSSVREGWTRRLDEARAAGYRGVRLVADRSWLAGSVAGAHRVAWYEALANQVFADGYAMGLCLYDRRLFPPPALRGICSAHPATYRADNDRWSPLLRMVRTVDPPGLRLVGEVDVSNRRAVAALLNGLFEEPGAAGEPLVVDVSDLSFADAPTATLFVRAAQASPAGLVLWGCSAPLAHMIAMVPGRHADGRLRIVPTG